MIRMLIGVGILFGLIFAWKGFGTYMMKRYFATMQEPPVYISAMKVDASSWQPQLKSVGSLRAQTGVNVTTELAGMVQTIYFTPGSEVKKDEVLVQLNADSELGQLHALQAQVKLAKITYDRDNAQFKVHAVSKQTLDADEWSMKNLQAQEEQQAAIVAKKTIKAPFSGQLGIRNINPGQYLNPADTIMTLQALDPLYADFYVPQQHLAELKLGQKVKVLTNTFPLQTFDGSITTIEPIVDSATRNVQVEATLSNPKHLLKPGMFAEVTIDLDKPQKLLTVPQSAISFNSFGDLIYLVIDSGKKDPKNQPQLTVKQVFVTLGDKRGDQVAVVKGLHLGDMIVTSGQLKLRNGSSVIINNSLAPTNEASPKIVDR